jgi:hypothetical protein
MGGTRSVSRSSGDICSGGGWCVDRDASRASRPDSGSRGCGGVCEGLTSAVNDRSCSLASCQLGCKTRHARPATVPAGTAAKQPARGGQATTGASSYRPCWPPVLGRNSAAEPLDHHSRGTAHHSPEQSVSTAVRAGISRDSHHKHNRRGGCGKHQAAGPYEFRGVDNRSYRLRQFANYRKPTRWWTERCTGDNVHCPMRNQAVISAVVTRFTELSKGVARHRRSLVARLGAPKAMLITVSSG